MNTDDETRPAPLAKGQAPEKARQIRAAEALRANLRRRKDQARARDGETAAKGSEKDRP